MRADQYNGLTQPWVITWKARSTELANPVFFCMFALWNLTVFSLIKSAAAISLLVMCLHKSLSTCISRGVSGDLPSGMGFFSTG